MLRGCAESAISKMQLPINQITASSNVITAYFTIATVKQYSATCWKSRDMLTHHNQDVVWSGHETTYVSHDLQTSCTNYDVQWNLDTFIN